MRINYDVSHYSINSIILYTINKPTRVKRKTTTATDHILTNSFTDTAFKTAIFKSDLSDHFPICFINHFLPNNQMTQKISYTKKGFDNESVKLIKQNLYKTSWDEIKVVCVVDIKLFFYGLILL